MQNSFIFRVSPLEVIGNVRLARIQSNRVVNLLILEVHINIGKNWLQNAVHMIKKRNWILFSPLRRRFHIRFIYFVLYLYFFVIVSLLTLKLGNFQFQSQIRLFQINVEITIRLNFKLYAVSIE